MISALLDLVTGGQYTTEITIWACLVLLAGAGVLYGWISDSHTSNHGK